MMVLLILVGGLILEIVGVVFMSSAVLSGAAKPRDQVTLLASAFIRGAQARGRTRTLDDLHAILGLRAEEPEGESGPLPIEVRARLLENMLNREAKTRLKALQGLAFLGVGILIQGVVTVALLLSSVG